MPFMPWGHCLGHSHQQKLPGPLSANPGLGKRNEGRWGFTVGYHCCGSAPPADYIHHQGWVLIAFHNALWQLLHAPILEEGHHARWDTDTNAAICGALLGALYGRNAIPDQWVNSVLNCRPAAG